MGLELFFRKCRTGVLSYYSHHLSKAERNYCITRRELLAVVAIQRFHPYLYRRSFTIRMDHAALSLLLNFKYPEGQISRWLEEVQQYDFVVEYRSTSMQMRYPDARASLMDANTVRDWKLRSSCSMIVVMEIILASLSVMELKGLLGVERSGELPRRMIEMLDL